MKPLYVTPEERSRVWLDGPSLVVETEGKAAARFPLRLVSAVVSAGRVEWSQEAVVACLTRRAPLTFLTGRGEVAGTALPEGDPNGADMERLEEMLADRGRVLRYGDWVRSEERRAVLRALRVVGLETTDLRSEAAAMALERKAAEAASGEAAREVVGWMKAALRSRLGTALARQKWCGDLLAGRREGFHFLRDAERVLQWSVYTDAERLLRRLREGKGDPEGLKHAALAESARLAARDGQRIDEFLDRFRFWLRGQR